jgi:hypothetical protein
MTATSTYASLLCFSPSVRRDSYQLTSALAGLKSFYMFLIFLLDQGH